MFDFSDIYRFKKDMILTERDATNVLVIEMGKNSSKRQFTVKHFDNQFHIYHKSEASNRKVNNGCGELIGLTPDLGKVLHLLGYRVPKDREWLAKYQKERTISVIL
jgi:hypothetical protein